MKSNLLCEEPYRIFFPLAILTGIAGIGHWLAFSLGWIASYSGFFHSSLQIQAFMTCFVLGFLLTAMPRFAQAPSASWQELVLFLVLILGVAVFLTLGLPEFSEACFIAILVSLLIFAGRRFSKRKGGVIPPVEFVWIPIALLHGIGGALLLIAGQKGLVPPVLAGIGKSMVEQGYMLSIVLGVGGFMGPRLMGTAKMLIPSEMLDKEQFKKWRARRIAIHAGLGLIFFLSFWMEGLFSKEWAWVLRAFLVTTVFLWTRTWPGQPRAKEFYVRLIWVSFWMILIGMWAAVLWPSMRATLVHFIFIGGFSLMTFAVATMVVLSHGGETARLQKPLVILKIVLAGVILALTLRVSAVFFPSQYFVLLGASSAVWIVTGASWLIFILPFMFRPSRADEFEKSHEEMKRRLGEI